jgi:predicted GNAT superfamily acetyltransferase
MTPSDVIVFRDIEQLSEMREVERLQKTIWSVEDLDILPALAMRPLIEVGGILIGAFDSDRMVGFVFGFPGHHNGENIIHSDMLGVLPEYRSFSLGYRLKLAQREHALAMGIETITWTFDPLRARNARLNFARLGVTADRYEIDYYGETSSALHRLGTDRLWVTWSLNSERVVERTQQNQPARESFSAENNALILSKGNQQEPLLDIILDRDVVLIEIPTDFDQILKGEPMVAQQWRLATRDAFTRALSASYVVRDFILEREAGKGTYILTS